MTTLDDETARLLFTFQFKDPVCLRLLQQLAERPESVIEFAEAGFAALQGLLDQGTPDILPFPAFFNQGLVGLDNQIPRILLLRGYLRDGSETSALDGVYNSLKSPLRLRVDEQGASLDQKCESVEYMITSLHRVDDLLTTLHRRMAKRAHVDISEVNSAMATLRKSEGFVYYGHFTNPVKHTIYIRRGEQAGVLYFDKFSYKDRKQNKFEPRRTMPEIVDYAREVVGLATNVMKSMSRSVASFTVFAPCYSEVCATPSPELTEDDKQP